MIQTRRSQWPVIAAAVCAALFVLLFLYLEAQWEIALLAIGLVAALFAAGRYGLIQQVETAASAHPRAAILASARSSTRRQWWRRAFSLSRASIR